ncbi:glycosyl hydrolase family 18 protein [Zobellia galactanivorans]|uniref:carbohydrate-binding protein n=1 Tax=Zobellia galactanivorans (strain DSM 12802 / CCUG 47099 / CIP 106680 / NCIMB 13871 / Dsij) TaxID=63186 RepID=UPI001C06F653|nr:carbohydrate-binding protein [Zobellia galactanivorans]MBU3025282.1 hypothetical protein [Zobellia galactanivorans]MDO6810494.1 glycosyl hydrolase family 18 protein [Zobellia galactanivorans]
MNSLKKIIGSLFLIPFLFSSCSKEIASEEQSLDQAPITPVAAQASSVDEPIVLGYFPSWSETWAASGKPSKLRDLPGHITHVFLAFAKPNLRYQKGSMSLSGTGIQTPYDGEALKETVSILKARGTNVILSIGGETYWGSQAAYDIDYQQIKDFVDDMGFQGIDWDYEPSGSFATIGEPENVQHFIDFFNKSRAIMPKGEYLLACAPAGAGALGGLNNDDPASPYAYSKRNSVTGESDDKLYKATEPNEAISLFGFGATGHFIPVMKAVGDKIDLVAYQGYNTGAASNRKIMYDAYKHYADQYGFNIAAGTHYPNEPWGPHYTYDYQTIADLSEHIASKSQNDGLMIWQLLLGDGNTSAYGYLHVGSQILNGVSRSTAIANAENYPGGGNGIPNPIPDPNDGTDCDSAAAWSATASYAGGVYSTYQNSLYRAKWWTLGDLPTSGDVWEFIGSCSGDDGGSGDDDGGSGDDDGDCSSIAQWSASAAYLGNAEVVYNGTVYRAKWWTSGEVPSESTGDGQPWEVVRSCN